MSGSFTDPQPNIPHVVTIDWGDETAGSPDTTTVDLAPGQTTFQAAAELHHLRHARAPTAISATIAGMDGHDQRDTSVTVTPVPAEVMIGAIMPAASVNRPNNRLECTFAVTCGGGSAGNVTVNFSLGGHRLRYRPGLHLIGQRHTITGNRER